MIQSLHGMGHCTALWTQSLNFVQRTRKKFKRDVKSRKKDKQRNKEKGTDLKAFASLKKYLLIVLSNPTLLWVGDANFIFVFETQQLRSGKL